MMRIADTLELQIGQMCYVGFEGLTAPDYLLDWLRSGRVGGVILFARNVESPAQVAALTDSLQAAAPYGVIISIDQEGGTVARLRDGFTESPGAMALSSAQDAESFTERVSHMLATELRALGIHWDYAPAVDISYNAANPSVGTRSFGSDAARVSRLGAAAIRGFQSAGVAASPKHFPGLGNTPIDTHLDLPVLDTPVEHLLTHDLEPYRAAIAANTASIMLTHVMYSALDPDHPVTVSPVVAQRLIRGELGYDGIVTTDCMEMQAVADRYGAGESAVLAALAGIDALLFSHTPSRQAECYEALLAAARSGRLPLAVVETANRRLAAFKQAWLKPRADLSIIRAPDHLALASEAAQAGTTLLRSGAALPLRGNVTVIEFPSIFDSGILESGGLSGFSRLLTTRLPSVRVHVVREDTPPESLVEAARDAETLVLATRNAHLNAATLALCQSIMASAERAVLVCLRNPYDAGTLGAGADSIVCTCGDSAPSLEAAVGALLGDYAPTGTLPVEVHPA
ncbi:MAG: beta-N-acetylhexosaminidase [Chloroflexota bacterium]|nr:beta-N-acetylhexosaminidase [Chloroflexota bacterium]